MRKPLLILAALGFLLGAAPSWAAEAPALAFDPPHGSVMFFVRHILADIPGRFTAYSGVVRFDPMNLPGSMIDVTVETASVDTGVAQRDEHLRTPDFFDSAKYPAMRFVSREIVPSGPGKYLAKGELTIKDVTKAIELPFEYLGEKPSPMEKGKTIVGFRSRLTIDMLDYHVSDGKFQNMGALGKDVEILINLEMQR